MKKYKRIARRKIDTNNVQYFEFYTKIAKKDFVEVLSNKRQRNISIFQQKQWKQATSVRGPGQRKGSSGLCGGRLPWDGQCCLEHLSMTTGYTSKDRQEVKLSSPEQRHNGTENEIESER